jgi:hypothetical protein
MAGLAAARADCELPATNRKALLAVQATGIGRGGLAAAARGLRTPSGVPAQAVSDLLASAHSRDSPVGQARWHSGTLLRLWGRAGFEELVHELGEHFVHRLQGHLAHLQQGERDANDEK